MLKLLHHMLGHETGKIVCIKKILHEYIICSSNHGKNSPKKNPETHLAPLPPSSFGPEVFKTEDCWGCEKTDLA